MEGVACVLVEGRLGVTASAYTDRAGVFKRGVSMVSAVIVIVVLGSSALEAREDAEGSLEASESGVRGDNGEVGGGEVGSGV